MTRWWPNCRVSSNRFLINEGNSKMWMPLMFLQIDYWLQLNKKWIDKRYLHHFLFLLPAPAWTDVWLTLMFPGCCWSPTDFNIFFWLFLTIFLVYSISRRIKSSTMKKSTLKSTSIWNKNWAKFSTVVNRYKL